jgi:hypothetical protein
VDQPVPLNLAQNVQRLRTKEQLVEYLHRAAGHPVKKTWLAAIKAGGYATWPGLTYEIVSKHLTNTEETAMGHLHKRRQNIRSTKPKPRFRTGIARTVLSQVGPYPKSWGPPSRHGRT